MPVGSVTIGGGGSAWMEDIVVVAGRVCTNAVLVCAGPSRRTGGWLVLRVYRWRLPWATLSAAQKRSVAFGLLQARSLDGFRAAAACTGEDDISESSQSHRKLLFCCIVIRNDVLNVDQRVAVPVITIPFNHVAHFQDPLAGHPHSSETDWRT